MKSEKLVIEELSRMKSLFGYERGRVISEQVVPGTPNYGFTATTTTPAVPIPQAPAPVTPAVPATKAPKAPVTPVTRKADPKVIELQKQIKASLPNFNLGTSGPNKDGIDGLMGPKTKEGQRQLTISKGQTAVNTITKQGQDLQNKWNSYGKMTPEQISNANALKAGQPLPQTKAPVAPAAPAAPVPTGPKPTGLGWAGQEQDGWVYDVNTKDWIPQS